MEENRGMENHQTFPNNELPPLPDRALTGMPGGVEHIPQESPFHTVHVWEFTNLYVLLNKKMWKIISTFLKDDDNHSAVALLLERGHGTLFLIRKNPNQSIHMPILKTIVIATNLDPNMVERSIRAVKFEQRGDPEMIKFPFQMDLYAWRVICHILGDGNVHTRDDRPYPYLRWTQEVKYHQPMRNLLRHLSREVKGTTMNINYPKALSYAILGTMLGMKITDLKTPKFIDFVIDLPMQFREYKVEFLAAFILDDGSISGDISLFQKNGLVLERIIHLCDHLGYDHSDFPLYEQDRDGMHEFQLRQRGVQKFYDDLTQIIEKSRNGKWLGLWHKQVALESHIKNLSDKRINETEQAKSTHVEIITLLSDRLVRDTTNIQKHPIITPLVKNLSYKLFRDRLLILSRIGVIIEVKKPNGRSYRPKKWTIPPNKNLDELKKIFKEKYGNRRHKHAYKRSRIPTDSVIESQKKLKKLGIKPTPENVAKDIGCSKKQIYFRPDLRALFDIDDNEKG